MKYDMALATLVDQKDHGDIQLDKTRFLNSIEAGIRHLHKLNLVNNDLNPSNLMIDHDNVPRIIEFDSCHVADQPLGPKGGTRGCSNKDVELSCCENDFSGLAMIRDYLVGPDPSVCEV